MQPRKGTLLVRTINHAQYRASLLRRLRPLCQDFDFANRLWGFQRIALFLIDRQPRPRPPHPRPLLLPARHLRQPPSLSHAIYLSGDLAFRLHPGLARVPDAWKLAYNDRTCTHRSHNRKRNDFGQLAGHARGRPTRAFHYFLAVYPSTSMPGDAAASLRAETVFGQLLAPHLDALLALFRNAAA